MRYESFEALIAVKESFENCTVNRGDWGHPEHLVVAYFYCSEHSPEMAYELMKQGIFRLLDAFEIDMTEEMPYHETLTLFWLCRVISFLEEGDLNPLRACNELINKFDKNYPMRFYTRATLFSDTARREFVRPDRSNAGFLRFLGTQE